MKHYRELAGLQCFTRADAERITVSGEGFLAATICHEIDHLDGVLFTDKIVAE